MKRLARYSLYLAAAGSVAAGLVHVWAIFSGPAAYASLGAPPDVVASAEAGTLYAPLITSMIAIVTFGWALYALSAAGHLPRLLWLRIGLIAICGVLLLRGIIIVPAYFMVAEDLTPFHYWSSFLCLGLGSLFLIGTVGRWPELGSRT